MVAIPVTSPETSSPGGTGQPTGVASQRGSEQPAQPTPTTQQTKLLKPSAPSWFEAIPAPAYILFLLIVLLLPVAWLTRRFSVESIVDDSQSFREALRIWDHLIAMRRQTPRAIKRFMNRLRFLAMRVRDVAQEELARGGTPPLDEPLLVTYAAMEELGVAESKQPHADARHSDAGTPPYFSSM
jgi:hypothetical protein